ncbi:hypothetical protein JYK00_04675 [Thermosipho ferrireducens]|uniref:Uncharacterized protein n=1 Tax=Thermosipho ferrireducens TaxID=2571116 RepID=A0ABX7SBB7_9BACT|nr:hypothetical protein [Thermosipho ferrireducens]QTA38806.1 hypothetical protein JYK00_04675 [Thermosipho ferrireducens]
MEKKIVKIEKDILEKVVYALFKTRDIEVDKGYLKNCTGEELLIILKFCNIIEPYVPDEDYYY